MNKLLFLIVFIILSGQSYSQGYINAKKSRCKKGLNKFLQKNNYQASVMETDSTLELHVRDTAVRPFDLVLNFNAKGRCVKEYQQVDCDSCFDKWLKAALDYKHLNWKAAGKNTWVSQIYMKRKMKADPATHSILVTREKWTKNEYEELTGKP